MKSIRIIILALLTATCSRAQPDSLHVLWDRSGLTDSSAFGYNILPLGDQNNDGYADWAVFAQGNGGGYHGTRASYLEFFYGGNPPSAAPCFVFREDSTVYHPLWYVDAIGDVNGDGYQDWMVSYWPLDTQAGSFEGIFFGGHGFSTTPDMEWPTRSGVGLYPFCNLYGGGSGNFNGDGYDDLYEYDFNTNVARIYYGGNPMDTIPDWVLHQPPPGINQTIPYAVGDFNGDGASDFMCFNPNSPFNLAVFLGGTSPDTIPAYFWSNQYDPIAGIDSLNGDRDAEWGGTYLHFGRPVLSPIPDETLHSIAGSYAADGGDFNGDGYHDLILYTWDTGINPFGALDLHLGHPWINPDPVFTIEGDTPPLYLRGIYTAIGVGDVNGDGLDDIAIGVWNETFGPWRGRCVIISGDTLRAAAHAVRTELPSDIRIEAFPNPFNSQTTIKLALLWSKRLNELNIYDALGRLVKHEMLPPFVTDITYRLDVGNLPSGSYFLQVRSGSVQKTQKLMLIR